MTYLSAADPASSAKSLAWGASGMSGDQASQQLARAVANLAGTVAELCRSLHRDS